MAGPADLVDVRPGDELDWSALHGYLRDVLGFPDGPLQAKQFTGGRANLTYLLSSGDQRVVLRRPPRGVVAPGAHDMAREHRVLSRLWRVYPRAPRALHYCADPAVAGAPFVVMECRSGVVIRDRIPPTMAHHDQVERRVCRALVDALADLHAVDVAAAGLDDLGRPAGFAERQVSGWADRWARAAPDRSADPDGSTSAVLMDEVAAELGRTVPAPQRTSIVHNDPKLDNCQFQPDDPDIVSSVFDWDMATLGDPLFDLANLLSSTRSLPVWVLARDEAVDRYAARCRIDVSGLRWYEAFAQWRTVVVMQQLYNRYVHGESSDDRLAAFGPMIPRVARQAHGFLLGG